MFEKIIWIYWEQGWEKAPLLCNLCKQSWEKLNSTTWKINALDKNNLNNYIDVNEINVNFWNITPIQTRSDIIRTLLLQKYGGIWTDSTVICIKPLDIWLFKNFDSNNENDFFLFKFLTNNINVTSWFLVSHPNNYIINKLAEKYTTFFKTNLISPHYLQFHKDFCSLLKSDKVFYKYYVTNKKLCAMTAKIFTCKLGFDGILNINDIVKKYNSPVYKLSYKIKLDYTKDTYVSELFKKIGIDIKRTENIIDENIKVKPIKIIKKPKIINIKNMRINNSKIKNMQIINIKNKKNNINIAVNL